MKTKQLLLILFISITTYSYGQFQLNYDTNILNHYHDLNIEPAQDGSSDVIIAGNLFNNSMTVFEPIVQRLDNNGTVIWAKTFDGSPLQNARIFDIETVSDKVILTGTVDSGGIKKAFAARVELASGNLLDSYYYEIVSTNFNSTALHITYTEADITGDGNPNPGFVIGGFFSDSYNVDTNAMNIGFVMRTWFDLEPIWVIEIDSNSGGSTDYDMVNHITETNDGYFITGASNDSTTNQQVVLAHKVDFFGNAQWDTSYTFGNSQDVSVDAYYDTVSNQIYMLTNYSISHQFGVTVMDNTTGNIIPAQSWYATENTLNHYGFTITESIADPDNLMIVGYDRDENWTDSSGNSYASQSNIFVYEFEKANGNQVGASFQYLVPHQEPNSDEYNFWNGQMPLIYYPDISAIINSGGIPYYFEIGYKTAVNSPFTQATLFKTIDDKKNQCDSIDLAFTPNAMTVTTVTVFSGPTPIQTFLLNLSTASISPIVSDCDSVLYIEDQGSLEGSYLYPNPANKVVYTTAIEASSFIIYDALGRNVSSGNISENKAISLENLKRGLYFIKITSTNNNAQTFKIFKE